jgi:serine/threonine-protein kinase RsbW
VRLGVTELLGNVLAHAGDPRCTLQLRRVGIAVVVTVADRSRDLPRILRPGPLDVTGRGLLPLQRLVDGRLAWWATPEGKLVWFSCGPHSEYVL